MLMIAAASFALACYWERHLPAERFVSQSADDCDLNLTACTASFDDERSIQLSWHPAPIKPNSRIRAIVRTSGLNVSAARFLLTGTDMAMGLVEADLSALDQDSFSGEVFLPVCIRGEMRWRATVDIEAAGKTYAADFRFDVRGQTSQ